MNNPYLLLLSAAIGAIISSLIAPYLFQSKERRTARGSVITAVTAVEQFRWGGGSYPKLKNKIHELKIAALIARADRQLIEYYSKLALTSHMSAEAGPIEDGDTVWLIPSQLARLMDDTLEALFLTLWHPLRTLPIRKRLLRRLKNKAKEIKRQDEAGDVHWQ